ncbi:MAG: type VI secretion system tip protein VgrG [Bacteroidota bacterium]
MTERLIPDDSKYAVVTFDIKIDGKMINPAYEVLRIDVAHAINRIPTARVELVASTDMSSPFEASESDDWVPGAEIEIAAGYGAKNKVIYKGLIVKHAVKFGGEEAPVLQLTCQDKSTRLTAGRKSACFLNRRDSDVMAELIKDAGLKADVEATAHIHTELVQYYASDWDFILTRAQANGLVVIVNDGTVTVGKPSTDEKGVVALTYGDSLLDAALEIDAALQLPEVQASAWDVKTQKMVTGHSKEPGLKGPGNLSGKKLSKVVGQKVYELRSDGAIPAGELKTWADAELRWSRLAKVQGTVSFLGEAKVLPGKLITLEGLGNRFNGDVYVSAVRHTLADGSWTTEATVGMPIETHAAQHAGIEAPANGGLLPGISGLHIGIVRQVVDPMAEARVQVAIPAINELGEGVWARLGNMYATAGAGAFFMPEVGDEVILGFVNEDPRFPIILGSLYSSHNKPPYTNNTMKALVTNSQLKLAFDDEQQIITLETPGGQVVTLSDEAAMITLKDVNNNQIKLSADGITLDSAKDITLKASGNIILDATAGIKQTANGDIRLDGKNINARAKISLSAKGNASAELSAAGQVTVKGAMVMIN